MNEKKINYKIEEVSDYKYFVFKSNQKYGVIDTTGKTIIEATYDKVEIPNPSKDVFICYKNEKGLAMNSSNQQLFSEYNSIETIELVNVVTDLLYEKSVLKSEINGKYGLIDFSGKKILNAEYDRLYSTGKDSFEERKKQIEQQVEEQAATLASQSLMKADKELREEKARRSRQVRERAQQMVNTYKEEMSTPLYTKTINNINNARFDENGKIVSQTQPVNNGQIASNI